jgi:16S rRNA (cytosine1402-N4)-methyltransferase
VNFSHQTVLLREAVALLKPEAGRVIIDGTLGGGGHTEALLEAGATVYGIDRDPAALEAASSRVARFGARFQAVKGEFGAAASLIEGPVDGFLLDLGVSSPQFDNAERGFSFMHDGPLDMRMGDDGETAAELIERLSADDLANVIYEFGDERLSRPIARALKAQAPKTTFEAVEAIKSSVPRKAWPKDIHVATRTFQGLRLAVNRELENLDQAIDAIPELLRKGGVAAFISFHSGEDRKVKQGFKKLCGDLDVLPRGLPVLKSVVSDFSPLTKKPIVATDEEVAANPRARSAKLRGIERVS